MLGFHENALNSVREALNILDSKNYKSKNDWFLTAVALHSAGLEFKLIMDY
jgi:hypothetical protein